MIKQARSVTHVHPLSANNTELGKMRIRSAGRPIRILEAGCGSGHLQAYLAAGLKELNPGMEIEVHGFDVHD